MKQKKCAVDGCSKDSFGLGYCRMHYTRLKRNGNVGIAEALIDRDGNVPRKCSIEWCTRKHHANDLCSVHYQRLKANIDLELPFKREVGTGSINQCGYKSLKSNGVRILEHRLLAELYLNRPLLRTENIHHRNGIKDDNTIGPCLLRPECNCNVPVKHNLELWNTQQPAGQRIQDKINWAKQILLQYDIDDTLEDETNCW